MTAADRQAFAALMLGLGETYGEPVTPARLEIYFAALSDLELDALRTAATAHVKLQKFFPRPAELREAVLGSVEDRADLAWGAVVQLVRRVGYHASPRDEDWPNPAAKRAALELYGGWKGLCASLPADGPELLGAAKLFKASYRAYDLRGQRQGLPPGETGRELSASEVRGVLSNLKTELQKRKLPTGAL